jgi:uncharacterized protein DUF2154
MKTNYLWIALVLFAMLIVGCGSQAKVGEMRNESQSVELGDAKSVRVEVSVGAGVLEVTGGAEKLLEGDFTYNVTELKPVVTFTDGTLLVQQPAVDGLPILQGVTDFRNEWNLHLADQVPMNLKVNMGAGNSDLQLAGLSLTRLDVTLGAGTSTINLQGEWARDLDINIDAGAAELTVRLPKDVGVRVEVDRGPAVIEASGLVQDGDIYTNAAYGVSNVTLHVNLSAGIGRINLEVDDE